MQIFVCFSFNQGAIYFHSKYNSVDYNRIEIKRKLLKLTQEELAKKANLTRVGYQKIIKKQSSTVETLELLSKALGMEMNFWWEDESNYAMDNPTFYGKTANDVIQDLLDDKKRMKARLDELESKLQLYEPKKKDGTSG